MIYCNLKSYQTLEIQGDNDSIITELTILLMELSRSDRGRMLLLSATEAAQDPKVKNMYEQDLKKAYSFEMNVSPSFDFAMVGNSYQPTAGLKLSVKF